MIREVRKYSLSFKRRVITEIENGKYNKNQAREIYGIKGGGTINLWIQELGINNLMAKVVKIETSNEINELKKYKDEIKLLKQIIANNEIAYHCQKVELEMYKEDALKKKRLESIILEPLNRGLKR